MIHTLGYVVANVQNRLQDYSDKKVIRWTQIAIDGYKLLNINYQQTVKVAYLEMNQANIVALPIDFVEYSKIGINACGNIWTLSVNNNMILPRVEKCGYTIREVCRCETNDGVAFDPPQEGVEFVGHWWNGLYNNHLFGAGGGFNIGYYRIDKEYNRIVFNPEMPKLPIILEYVSNGLNYSGDTIIPELAVDYLVRYVINEEYMFGNYNGYDKQIMAKELDAARHQFNWNKMKPILSEMQDMHWRTRRRVKTPFVL